MNNRVACFGVLFTAAATLAAQANGRACTNRRLWPG